MIGVLGFDSRRGLGIFLFTTASRMAPGPTQPSIQCEPAAPSPRVKRPGRKADHLNLVPRLMRGAYTLTRPYVFLVWCLVKYGMSSWCGA